MRHRKYRPRPVAAKRVGRRTSNCDAFTRVMRQLAAEGGTRPRIDPFVEKLRQCPEAFRAGEMVGKMLDALKYRQEESAADERLLPPAGVVMPLV